MIIKCVNAYYFQSIQRIGGIESHLYYVAKKYKNRDITIFYQDADKEQIRRYSRYVKCIRLKSDMEIECEKMFCCFNREILRQVKKGKKYLVLHGDYSELIKIHSIGDLPIANDVEYLGVSQLVCDTWKQVTGHKAKNIYEPVVVDKCDKPLHFIMASRLSIEKGVNELNKLIDILNQTKTKWLLDIYTAHDIQVNNPNVRVLKPRLDIVDFYPCYDALIQASKTEGYGLSVVEALTKGIPVIVTPCPVYKELGVDETNSVTIPFDFNADKETIEKIKNIRKLKVKYKPIEDKWGEVLVDKPNKYKAIHCITTGAYKQRNITDNYLGYIPEPNEEIWVSKERYEELINNRFNLELVKKIEEK